MSRAEPRKKSRNTAPKGAPQTDVKGPLSPVAATLPFEEKLDLEHSLPVLITMLANKIGTTGSQTFRKRHGLGATDWKALATLAGMPGRSGAEVADFLGMDRAAISRSLAVLADMKLVKIEKAQKQGNHQSINLTPKGRELHGKAIVTAWERERAMVEGMSIPERARLVEGLRRLLANMDRVATLAGEPQGTIATREGLEHLTGPTSHRDESSLASESDMSIDSREYGSEGALTHAELAEENRKMRSIIADLMLQNMDLKSSIK